MEFSKKDDEFMEVDDDSHGWSEDEEDYEQFKEPEFEKYDSTYNPKLTCGFQYKIISEEEIAEKRQALIKEVKEVLGFSEEESQKLLINHRFDKDKAIQSVFDQQPDMDEDLKEPDCKFNSELKSHTCLVCF